ncbi:MAG TPA: DUF993 family protein [Trebonia sp.]|jgi:hypothetical protein|nr:DUF993 family protein [Trebonia sp.]
MTGTARISLPGRAEPLEIAPPPWAAGYPPPSARRVYAAAHVASADGVLIDWESTMRFRDHLWEHGFAVAEAMDTAQRGMGLSWDQARELIASSAERAAARRAAGRYAALACGAGTDHLPAGEAHSIAAITGAYAAQLQAVQAAGAKAILMASRALAAAARGPRDYLEVYGALLRQASQPVILHWLGEAFDPALRGYWGGADFETAAATVLDLIDACGDRVDGIKLSVLDAGKEVALRRRLPAGVRLYTGDDFGYADLIRGDETGHSDALLGAFAAVTAPAAAALHALDAGDLAGYDAAIGPTVPLSRLIFEEPVYYYKAGVAFLAWLNGLQPRFALLGGLEGKRPAGHFIAVFELAAAAGALRDPGLAVSRMAWFLRARA